MYIYVYVYMYLSGRNLSFVVFGSLHFKAQKIGAEIFGDSKCGAGG